MSEPDYPNIKKLAWIIDGLLGMVFFTIKILFWLIAIGIILVMATK